MSMFGPKRQVLVIQRPTREPSGWWPLIKIEKKTNLVALVAFILSLSTATWQLRLFLIGANVELVPPSQVVLKSSVYGSSNILHINATMTYINRGAKGYADVVAWEYMVMGLGSNTVYMAWQKFGNSFRNATNSTKLEFTELGPAIPFALDGASATSHETNFQPGYDYASSNKFRNYLDFNMFRAALDQNSKIDFRFGFITENSDDHFVECNIPIDDDLKNRLRDFGWSAPSTSAYTSYLMKMQKGKSQKPFSR